MSTLFDDAVAVLKGNWKDGYTIPCAGLYPFQWNWDSGFIALGWGHVDMDKAQQEIRSLLKGQWTNGFIPHIVFHKEADSYYPGPEVHAAHLSGKNPVVKTSGITQPPVLGFILEALYDIAADQPAFLDFAAQVYDAIYANHHYFYTHRDPKNEGLVYICHNWEAGTDNTPVWDAIWETFEVPEYTMKRKDTQLIDASHRPTNKEYQYYIHLIELFKSWKYDDATIAAQSPFLIQDPLFNSVLIRANEGLIRIGKLLGKDEQVAQLEGWSEQAKDAMNAKLFSEENAGYIYYDLRNDRPLAHISSSSFVPLYAGIPNEQQAATMIRDFQGGRFSGPKQQNYLCASFDPTSELFNSKKYWRGPIWINLNWMIYKGLMRYGYPELAAQIREDSLFFMQKYGFYEYFEPSKEANETLTEGYGGNHFSWSAALTIDFLKS